MHVTVTLSSTETISTPALIVNVFEGDKNQDEATRAVDAALNGAISQLIEEGEIKGHLGEMTLIHTFGRIPASRVLVAGLGKQKYFNQDIIRRVTGEACRFLQRRGLNKAATIAHGVGVEGIGTMESGQAITEGAILGLYRFSTYITKTDNNTSRFEELTIIERNRSNVANIEAGVKQGSDVADGVLLARELVNEPANSMTPSRMAAIARKLADEEWLECQILEAQDMKELGMGSFLGVAQGSIEPPKLIVLRYLGDTANPNNNIGLIGKGITFDSGGLSLKSASGMEDMKRDMAGGAAVMGAMKILSRLGPKLNIIGIIGATENMPSGSAQRPGDIVRAMSGKTIEVLNTDAEGRLVLADLLCYARHLGLTQLVDVATLTGAIVVALGHRYSGVMGNNQSLVEAVISAGNEVGEPAWQLPLHEDYKNQLKSNAADLKNVGGRGAGSITAAMFLAEFAENTPWSHMDVAGTTFTDKDSGYLVKGATGVPTRTLVKLCINLSEFK